MASEVAITLDHGRVTYKWAADAVLHLSDWCAVRITEIRFGVQAVGVPIVGWLSGVRNAVVEPGMHRENSFEKPASPG